MDVYNVSYCVLSSILEIYLISNYGAYINFAKQIPLFSSLKIILKIYGNGHLGNAKKCGCESQAIYISFRISAITIHTKYFLKIAAIAYKHVEHISLTQGTKITIFQLLFVSKLPREIFAMYPVHCCLSLSYILRHGRRIFC
jgi:hypothetical protein